MDAQDALLNGLRIHAETLKVVVAVAFNMTNAQEAHDGEVLQQCDGAHIG